MGLSNELAQWRAWRQGVVHTTLNPEGPGAVRFHLVPPRYRLYCLVFGRRGYRRGLYFYHGGGGCACACAGCACACACTGGCRAGCSAKDFYQPNPFAASCRKAEVRREFEKK